MNKDNSSIERQLDKLGPEYRTKMEEWIENTFPKALVALSELFKCTKDINDLEQTGNFPMVTFLRAFFDLGFYGGLKYGIQSTKDMVVEDKDLVLKYSDEINEEILNSVQKII